MYLDCCIYSVVLRLIRVCCVVFYYVLAMFLPQWHLKEQWVLWMWCVACDCVLVWYTAEPPNVIGRIQQTLHEWCLLSPPSDITPLSHLFSPRVHALNWASLQVGGVSPQLCCSLPAVVRHGQTCPDVCAFLCFMRLQIWEGISLPTTCGKKKHRCLAKLDLRTEKVWSFISQQIQIRILIQPLNPLYPFNPRLGMFICMWVRDR